MPFNPGDVATLFNNNIPPLFTATENRFSVKVLNELFHPQNNENAGLAASGGFDTEALNRYLAAQADVIVDFEDLAEETFDQTNTTHVALGAYGIVGYLQQYLNQTHQFPINFLREFHNRINRYAARHQKRRFHPQSLPSDQTLCPGAFATEKWDPFLVNDGWSNRDQEFN